MNDGFHLRQGYGGQVWMMDDGSHLRQGYGGQVWMMDIRGAGE